MLHSEAALKQSGGEPGEEKEAAARGATSVNGFVVCENFAMIYGCSPDMGVLAKTTMIKDVADIF